MRKKTKKAKIPKIDGLSPKDIGRIRSALRKVWRYSHPHKLCTARATLGDDYFRCEGKGCKKKVPKIHVDHIERVGDVDSGYIKRLFVSSKGLQALCTKCHKIKTAEERAEARLEKTLKGL